MKKFLLTSTAILSMAILTNSFAQTGGTTGGSGTGTGSATGTPTRSKDDKTGGTTGGGTVGSGGASTGSGGASTGTGGSATGSDKTGSSSNGAAVDMKNLKALPVEGTTCCADIIYRDAKKGMILVAENPFDGKFVGRKLTFKLMENATKTVPASKYKVMRDNDANLIIVPNGLNGKGYILVVTVNGTKESATYKINLM